MSPPSEAVNARLKIHLCDLRSGASSWSATVAIEGTPEDAGLAFAIFYEGRRLSINQLDEWGHISLELDDLPPPRDLTATTHFEVRTKRPPRAYLSSAFHPPLVSDVLLSYLEQHRAWPRSLSLRGAQLQGASLGQADLKGVDFTGANFTGAKLWKADLTGAILQDATLDAVDLTDAQLNRADLQNASVENTSWEGVELKGADIRGLAGLSSNLLLTWGHSVTLDESQQARLKLLGISQRDPTSSHYVGLSTIIEHEQTPPPSEASPQATFSIKPPLPVKKHSSRYESGEHTFYRSPKPSERGPNIAVEEESPHASVLPPEPEGSPEERRAVAQREADRFQRQLLKYQQRRRLRNGVEFKLNMIPNGEFVMGSDSGEPKDRPRHKVKLKYPLLVGETLVTQELFSLVMGPHSFKFEGDQLPAESISWNEALRFCNRLSRLEGLSPAYRSTQDSLEWVRDSNGYRLPTEAEWEYFARANTPYHYSGGDEVNEVAWFKDNARGKPQPVAQKPHNAWGLYDVSGNLWEWCFDTFHENAYHKRKEITSVDPLLEGEGPKVIRGGSWSYDAEGLSVTYRSRLAAKFKTSRIGFRVVRSPKLKSRDS